MATKPETGAEEAPVLNRTKLSLADIFLPNRVVSRGTFLIISAFWIVGFLLIWSTNTIKAIPRPGEVLHEFSDLWNTMGLAQELLKSMDLNIRALIISGVICLGLAYLTVIPFFRPEWKVVWEVVIRGTFDQAFEVMRQNAAIGWMMLTMVEGIVRSAGGVGAMLLNEQKHMKIEAVFAIQIIILVIGLCQDYLIGVIRRLVCPYAVLTLERK